MDVKREEILIGGLACTAVSNPKTGRGMISLEVEASCGHMTPGAIYSPPNGTVGDISQDSVMDLALRMMDGICNTCLTGR